TLDALGAPFIESIHGDPSTVVGISLPTLRRLIGELGVGWTSLWRTSGNTGDLPR
ncbi:MAG: septum formation inhibitor Maf, partial [Actinomycetota bacterium]|nr:septum formation inhibitor Maf [Actinomycetota bacterium]